MLLGLMSDVTKMTEQEVTTVESRKDGINPLLYLAGRGQQRQILVVVVARHTLTLLLLIG